MQIKFASILVDDQAAALAFYTDVIGFTKMADIPMGEYRWLTVTAPEGVAGAELVLEPAAFPAAKTFREALYAAGIPATAFITHDLAAEHARLVAHGVSFRSGPTEMGNIRMAVFDDTCGNLINLVQPLTPPA